MNDETVPISGNLPFEKPQSGYKKVSIPGKPLAAPAEPKHKTMDQRRHALDFDRCISDINTEIDRLRKHCDEGTINNAITGAAKIIVQARLSMLTKIVPDLKSHEVNTSGHVDHLHLVAPVSNLELASRLQLWRKQNGINNAEDESKMLLNEIIDITPSVPGDAVTMPSSSKSEHEIVIPERVVPAGAENTARLDGLNLPDPTEPEYDFL